MVFLHSILLRQCIWVGHTCACCAYVSICTADAGVSVCVSVFVFILLPSTKVISLLLLFTFVFSLFVLAVAFMLCQCCADLLNCSFLLSSSCYTSIIHAEFLCNVIASFVVVTGAVAIVIAVDVFGAVMFMSIVICVLFCLCRSRHIFFLIYACGCHFVFHLFAILLSVFFFFARGEFCSYLCPMFISRTAPCFSFWFLVATCNRYVHPNGYHDN